METFYDDFEFPPTATLEEYLHTHFRPDVDFVDGQLYARLFGEFPHSAVRGELLFALQTAEVNGLHVLPSIRIRTAPTRIRVADIALVNAGNRTLIVEVPPRLCVEVLEPQDDVTLVRQRCDDFLAFGVPQVWLVDPSDRTCRILRHDSESDSQSGTLQLEGTPLNLSLQEVFSVLDDYQA